MREGQERAMLDALTEVSLLPPREALRLLLWARDRIVTLERRLGPCADDDHTRRKNRERANVLQEALLDSAFDRIEAALAEVWEPILYSKQGEVVEMMTQAKAMGDPTGIGAWLQALLGSSARGPELADAWWNLREATRNLRGCRSSSCRTGGPLTGLVVNGPCQCFRHRGSNLTRALRTMIIECREVFCGS